MISASSERAEYESYVHAIRVIGVLQVHAHGELRKALEDKAKAPRFIETVPDEDTASSRKSTVQSPRFEPAPPTQHPAPILIGRESDLAQLHHWLAKALHGHAPLQTLAKLNRRAIEPSR